MDYENFHERMRHHATLLPPHLKSSIYSFLVFLNGLIVLKFLFDSDLVLFGENCSLAPRKDKNLSFPVPVFWSLKKDTKILNFR